MGWVRRHARVGALLAATGCLSSGGSGACSPVTNGGLGQASFTYVCPTGGGPHAPGPDAWCDSTADRSAIPDVAIGAPFRLAVDRDSTGGPQPAVPGLAQSTPQGWALAQEGWLGFLAWSGPDVIDFTHVRGEPVASLVWDDAEDATPTSLAVSSSPVLLSVSPMDANGATLGGALACTFSVSDPSVLAVTGTGRVASVLGLASGDATLTAACGGVEARTSIHVGGSTSVPEAAADDTSDLDLDGADDADDGPSFDGGDD
jgi:hypothetical protein